MTRPQIWRGSNENDNFFVFAGKKKSNWKANLIIYIYPESKLFIHFDSISGISLTLVQCDKYDNIIMYNSEGQHLGETD